MLESIIALDHQLFQLLNSQLVCGFFDWFMPFITDAKTWLPFVLIAWLYMVCSGGRQMKVLALALLVSVGLTDIVCARIIKKAVGRQRPCAVEQTDSFKCRLLLEKKTSKSFPSNHSANTAAFAVATATIVGFKPAVPLILLAFLVGYSRVYVGVHFPVDVVAGWLTGALLACFISSFIKKRFHDSPEAVPANVSAESPKENPKES